MTTPADQPTPETPHDTNAEQAAVSGGSADRLDSPGEGSGGVPAAGADGVTGAREQLRKDLGERSEGSGTEGGMQQDDSRT